MGESEQRLRLKFDEARSKALKTKRPVILFIDELVWRDYIKLDIVDQETHMNIGRVDPTPLGSLGE